MAAVPFELINLKRGNGYLIEAYIFIKNRERNNIINLKCQQFREGCKATAKISNGQAFLLHVDHSHDLPDLPAVRFRNQLMRESRDPRNARTPLPQLYQRVKLNTLNAAPSAVERQDMDLQLQSYSSVHSAMHSQRTGTIPVAPRTLAEIDYGFISAHITTQNGQPFLLADSADNERILVFGNREYLQRLSTASQIHIDGTFWSTPNIFYQLVTIHTFICNQNFPLVYALLPGKAEALYDKLFAMVQYAANQLGFGMPNLTMVMTDFEKGLINSVQRFFPHANHVGCSFHFAQACYRHVVSMGYQQDYRTDAQFRSGIRKFIALGHVPQAEKHRYYHLVMAEAAGDQRLSRFAQDYFHPTWMVGGFGLGSWTWYQIPVRTNNHVEAWHAGLKRFFVTPHLSLYKFLAVLVEEEKKVNVNLSARINGAPLPRENAKYRNISDRIANIHGEFQLRLPMDYISGISSCVPGPHCPGLEHV